MKRSNFLKSIIFIMVMAIMSFTFNSCEKDEVPACEKNHTGSVRIINNSAYVMTVDVWDDVAGHFIAERVLSPGASTVYSPVHSGYIEVWEEDQFSPWGYWVSSVSDCQETEFTISIYKSTGKTLMLKSERE